MLKFYTTEELFNCPLDEKMLESYNALYPAAKDAINKENKYFSIFDAVQKRQNNQEEQELNDYE